MIIRKVLLNSNSTNIPISFRAFELVKCRIKFRKGGGGSGVLLDGIRGPIEEENSDLPPRYHRRYLMEEEIAFINSGGASKFDIVRKKDARETSANMRDACEYARNALEDSRTYSSVTINTTEYRGRGSHGTNVELNVLILNLSIVI
ncbi:hypothetical protein Trydic_g5670 [Trypoxylus dichotomus]